MTYYEELKNGDKKLPIQISEKTKENIHIILPQMQQHEYYTTSEISEMVGLKASRIRETIQLLLKLGKLESSGSQRNRTYIKV